MPIKMINLHHLRDSKTLKIAPKLLRVLKVEQKEFSSVLLEVSSVCSYASVNLVFIFCCTFILIVLICLIFSNFSLIVVVPY